MSYNNSNNKRDNYRRNNDNKRQAIQKKKEEILKKQAANLEMIAEAARFLDQFVLRQDEVPTKITMKEILSDLIDIAEYDQNDTRAVSQFNYIMMDLANAQKSSYISGNRINIRILYIQERLKTSFKKELHDKIDNIMDTYSNLFRWNDADDTDDPSIDIKEAPETVVEAPIDEEAIKDLYPVSESEEEKTENAVEEKGDIAESSEQSNVTEE